MEAAYNELLEIDIAATPPININTPMKVKLPVAKEIKKLRKSGSSDSEIVEFLLETDGLAKPATPKSKDQDTAMKFKRQAVIFTTTPPPIKRVLQTESSEINKPQKQLKRKMEKEKVNSEERIAIKENNESGKNRPLNNKFQQKFKTKNAIELIQKFPTKGNLSNGYLIEHFKDSELEV